MFTRRYTHIDSPVCTSEVPLRQIPFLCVTQPDPTLYLKSDVLKNMKNSKRSSRFLFTHLFFHSYLAVRRDGGRRTRSTEETRSRRSRYPIKDSTFPFCDHLTDRVPFTRYTSVVWYVPLVLTILGCKKGVPSRTPVIRWNHLRTTFSKPSNEEVSPSPIGNANYQSPYPRSRQKNNLGSRRRYRHTVTRSMSWRDTLSKK